MMLLGQQGGSAPGKTGFGNIMSGQLANVADKMHLGGQLGRLRAGAASIMRPSGSKAAQPAVSAPRKRSSDEGKLSCMSVLPSMVLLVLGCHLH